MTKYWTTSKASSLINELLNLFTTFMRLYTLYQCLFICYSKKGCHLFAESKNEFVIVVLDIFELFFTIQVNYLAQFLLIGLFLPIMKKTSQQDDLRLVLVSSDAHKYVGNITCSSSSNQACHLFKILFRCIHIYQVLIDVLKQQYWAATSNRILLVII